MTKTEINILYKIVDKLEQRIALLERLVPYWHKNSIEEIKEQGSLTESQYDDSTYTLNTGE